MNHSHLLESKLFTGLSHAELESLVSKVRPTETGFQRGDTIWREGEVVDGLGLLEEGLLLCQRFHPDGKVQLARLFRPGDILNVEAAVSRKRTSPTHVIAATAGSFVWFSGLGIFDDSVLPERTARVLQANLLAYLADDAIRFMKKSDILSRRTVRERVIMYFNVLREQHGDELDIGMTQEELAQYLCVDRSSLSEELNKMRRDGLIDFHKKNYRLFF